jgi:predicted acetyltransferase
VLAFLKRTISNILKGAEPRVNDIEIVPATQEHELIITNLFELYVHDFTEFHHLDLDRNGRFGYEYLSLNWKKQGRHPFLISVNGNLAGFAFVKKGSELCGSRAVWDVSEFFVVRAYRKQGIGTRVAHELWKRFLGPWEIRVMPMNRVALRFWEQAVEKFLGTTLKPTRIEREDVSWYVFAFISSPLEQAANQG